MRDRPTPTRTRRAAVAALLAVGAGGGGANVTAFAPSRAHTRGCISCSDRRRQHLNLQFGVALGAVGTKRPRSTDTTAIETDTTTHNDRPAKPKIEFGLLPDFMQKDPLLVTKQTWLEKTNPPTDEEDSPLEKRKNMEMMAMSAATLALSVGVIYALASSAPDMVPEFGEEGRSEGVVAALREGNIERLEFATRNILDTVVPQSAEDVIAVSIGEGIAGVIGALATWALGMILNFSKSEMGFVVTPVNEAMEMEAGQMDALVSEAVADGDYFLTRAAAQPLLEAFGLPVFVASFASVLIATLPYEAVKLTSRKRQQAAEEEVLLQQLLEEEERRRGERSVVDDVSNRAFDFFQQLYVRADENDEDFFEDEEEDELEALRREQLENVPGLDYIELFADITKWLEYDVLISNYRGILALPNGQMLTTGWESAIFGLLAALSSQLYTDVLYLYSDFGNPEKREATINRSIEGWASVYATRCLGAATLFGTYEFVRAPASRFVSRFVSGGIGGCVGSQDYDLCVETYLVDNPLGASSGLDSLDWLLPLGDGETAGAFFRGAAVSLSDVLAKLFEMIPSG